MDRVTPEQRSWNMSRVRSTNTKPELLVRSILHRQGYRFRLHRSDLPGRPDIVLPRFRVAIFVHGCFWHQHEGCASSSLPKTRRSFWQKKLLDNAERDRKNQRGLRSAGWHVIVLWECELKRRPEEIAKNLISALQSKRRREKDDVPSL